MPPIVSRVAMISISKLASSCATEAKLLFDRRSFAASDHLTRSLPALPSSAGRIFGLVVNRYCHHLGKQEESDTGHAECFPFILLTAFGIEAIRCWLSSNEETSLDRSGSIPSHETHNMKIKPHIFIGRPARGFRQRRC